MRSRSNSDRTLDFLQDLFGPDFVLPEQFYATRGAGRAPTGERALLWAVFSDGIESFRRTAHSSSPQDREEFRETESWVMATDWDSLCSFANLCEIFGFDPDSVRQALLAWKNRGDRAPRQRFRPPALRAA